MSSSLSELRYTCADETLMLGGQRPEVSLVQALDGRQNRSERSANLVAHVGEELGLQDVQLFQLFVGVGEIETGAELAEAHLPVEVRT